MKKLEAEWRDWLVAFGIAAPYEKFECTAPNKISGSRRMSIVKGELFDTFRDAVIELIITAGTSKEKIRTIGYPS